MEEEVVFVFVEIEGGERFEYVGNVKLYQEASDAKNTKKSADTYSPGISL